MWCVYVYKWEPRLRQERQVGRICLHDNHLEAEPPGDPVLEAILDEPIRGDRYHPEMVSAEGNPRQFLDNLSINCKSPYLTASKPQWEEEE